MQERGYLLFTLIPWLDIEMNHMSNLINVKKQRRGGDDADGWRLNFFPEASEMEWREES